ncbi:aldo-keto reductase [Myriangium duriaei CBS 260.36]|uniref:Aldo-keto reductase n=1 Tax=Myriangium duriaei CBS 260.36 TaxID=1168546 RepID=A0A9P4J925_9PEZI|nr:aldo-keto reductase [Myriangium duriaei CBS 260.36]
MAAKLTLKSTLPLVNLSQTIPVLGFGVYLSPTDVAVKSCLTALKAGYRHIDTAQYYANEAEVGEAIRQSGIPRSELYITTKILSCPPDAEGTYQSIVESVKKIDAGDKGYVDLFLIHSPNSGAEPRKRMWQALERAHKEGLCKAIGVSNFGIGHIEQLKDYATVWPPHANQIELHAWCQQREVVDYCQKNKIVVEAYCPIVRNQKANDKTAKSIADKHHTSVNQVLIRYCLQKGWVPLPKSDTPSRIEANADVFGFELDKDDMSALDGLDQGASGAIVQVANNDSTK